MGSKPICKGQKKELQNEIIQDSEVKPQIHKRTIHLAALRSKQAQLQETSPLPEKDDTDIDELTQHFRELELLDQYRRLRINRFQAEVQSVRQSRTQRSNDHSKHNYSNPLIRPIKGILKHNQQISSQKLHKSVQFQKNTHPKLKSQHQRIHHQVLSLQFKATNH